MIQTLNRFSSESLFDATSHLLNKLNIEFDRETAEPINVADLYDGPIPQYLTDALECIKDTYFIGIVNDKSLAGAKSADSLDDVAETIQHGGKYDGMFVFACDAKQDANLTRTAATALTRAFNRIASANPVILIIRQNNLLSLSTCERMSYSQEWRQGSGEKLGKVSILRNINCVKPHRGHVDILESLGDKAYPTFEELYKHWMEVFSNELLTKKFYSELSDWYAWAVMVAKFPNDLNTEKDDAKYNHEACIRLVTRLIFVWFLKQKHLIPEEFFDETYIRDNLIDNFDPHDKQSLYYDAGESKYYRLILQNLFFAMLNCPIVAEGKTIPNNRRFRGDGQKGYKRDGYNVNNLMRYKAEFKEGGADKFVQIANSHVPFLNGGLFDCLDKKPEKLYYDGFSEKKESLEQLYLPDWLFFGEEVGNGIDLSQWYDDKKKTNVSARGLIDILKSYSFTIEENTPLEQEVSLDPELLGKVFENLLAAYNPETKQSARKQTGSFYTPREIVQYMVDESLVAHLKRTCGEELEPEYRKLLSYSTEETSLNEEQRKAIMHAVYNCRVLDPACGSGAFPMGVLQQLVHVLRQLDPTNEMWKDFMIDLAIEQSKLAFSKDKEAERKARLDDIENAFNQNINDPDYARKLYLIEHCIYGVDIQPIATQISKLRFFISLVVDQKPTKDAKTNFGIRPLPNLEAKFVTANTLIPLDRSRDLFSSCEDIRFYEERLQDINHRIFLAKKNSVKERLQYELYATRATMAQIMQNNGFIGSKGYSQLMSWDMFNQNSSASFFDPEWMFGVNGGFDVVIGNPPYIKEYTSREAFVGVKGVSPYYMGKMDLWYVFACYGLDLTLKNGVLCFIAQNNWTTSFGAKLMRDKIIKDAQILKMLDFNDYMVFEDSASIQTMVMLFANNNNTDNYRIDYRKLKAGAKRSDMIDLLNHVQTQQTYFDIPLFSREKFKNKFILFDTNDLLGIIENNKEHFTKDEIAQGIVFPQDFLNKKSVESLNNPNFQVGDGVFGLSDLEYKQMNLGDEAELIRPYYTSSEIFRYITNPKNHLWMIYTDSSYSDYHSLDNYPIIKHHLDQFQTIITSSSKPYGLHRARKESFFKGEKIVAQRKCVGRPVFSYSDFDCYVTQTYNIISTDRWNLKFLTGLLNSTLARYWFKNKGKMQGENYQIDKEPLLNFPIASNSGFQTLISDIVSTIISLGIDAEIVDYEQQIDHLVYHLYGLTYDEVLIIDPETPISRAEFDNFKLD